MSNSQESVGNGEVQDLKCDPKLKAKENESYIVEDWQSTKTSLKDRFNFLYCNEILCDIYFTFGNDHNNMRIPAHKFILSCGSAVFNAMFYGPLSCKEDSIELPDVDPSAFLSFLRYIYTDEMKIHRKTVMNILYIAKKYNVSGAKNLCYEFLKKNFNSEDAFEFLTQAQFLDEPYIVDIYLNSLDSCLTNAVDSLSFLDIDVDTLCSVIKRDTIQIDEVELFKAVVNWGKAECIRKNLPKTTENLREVIEKPLKLIRFPLMSVEAFASNVAVTKLLTEEDTLKLFIYLTGQSKPKIHFSVNPRYVSNKPGKSYYKNQ